LIAPVSVYLDFPFLNAPVPVYLDFPFLIAPSVFSNVYYFSGPNVYVFI
jgi:hypothetical protein